MIVLIDADIIPYKVGFASQDVPEGFALARADSLVKSILEAVGSTEYQLWQSDTLENNFRYKLDSAYKANRKDAPRPIHYEAIKGYLQQEWGAQITPFQEADDALGIRQTPDTIIVSIDKDLLQVPGKHYNFVRNEFRDISFSTGNKFFYYQLLSGDRVDNIGGYDGKPRSDIPKFIESMLSEINEESDLFECVREKYNDDERLLLNGRLLKIRQKEGELWEFPNVRNHTNGSREQGSDMDEESFRITPNHRGMA